MGETRGRVHTHDLSRWHQRSLLFGRDVAAEAKGQLGAELRDVALTVKSNAAQSKILSVTPYCAALCTSEVSFWRRTSASSSFNRGEALTLAPELPPVDIAAERHRSEGRASEQHRASSSYITFTRLAENIGRTEWMGSLNGS